MGKRTKTIAKESAHGNSPRCYQVHLFLLIAEMFITICLSLLGPKDYQSGDQRQLLQHQASCVHFSNLIRGFQETPVTGPASHRRL